MRDKKFPKEEWLDEKTRRRLGVTYTPSWIVEEMVRWAKEHGNPARVVDTGAGTGLFTFAAVEAFQKADILAIEVEPKSARQLRKVAAKTGHALRIKVMQRDYLHLPDLPPVDGKTLFIGNPPYVRHHLISARKKQLYLKLAREFGLHENTKAGLHLHFFLKTRKLANPGDYGIFIAAAEWIHADYGELDSGNSVAYKAKRDAYVAFLTAAIEAIPLLKEVSALTPDLMKTRIPAFRDEGWVCLSATGLNMIARLGFEMMRDGEENWQEYVAKMATID